MYNWQIAPKWLKVRKNHEISQLFQFFGYLCLSLTDLILSHRINIFGLQHFSLRTKNLINGKQNYVYLTVALLFETSVNEVTYMFIKAIFPPSQISRGSFHCWIRENSLKILLRKNKKWIWRLLELFQIIMNVFKDANNKYAFCK